MMKKYYLFTLLFIMTLCLQGGCSDNTEDDKPAVNTKPTVTTDLFCVDGLNKKDASLGFDVKVDETKQHKLIIRGLTSSNVDATISLYINKAKITQLKFEVSPLWVNLPVNVTLNAGENEILLKRDADDNGLLFVEYIELP